MSLLLLSLLAAAFAVMQLLLGGTRLLFALPADALLGVAAVSSIFRWRSTRAGLDGFCAAAAVLFAAAIAGRAWFSPVSYLAWPDLLSVTAALVVYLLVAVYLTDPVRRLSFLGVLLALAVAQLLVGARQFAGGDGYMLLQWEDSVLNFIRSPVYNGRASGFYICPNHLAGYLEIVGCLASAAALRARVRPWVRLLFGYGALVCFSGVLLTGSRGGLLSTAVGLGVLAIGTLVRARTTAPGAFRRTFLLTLVCAGILAGGTGAMLVRSQFLKNRVSTTFDTGDIRLLLWPAAWRHSTSRQRRARGVGLTFIMVVSSVTPACRATQSTFTTTISNFSGNTGYWGWVCWASSSRHICGPDFGITAPCWPVTPARAIPRR